MTSHVPPPLSARLRAGPTLPLVVGLVSLCALVYAGLRGVDTGLVVLAGVTVLATLVWLALAGASPARAATGDAVDTTGHARLSEELDRRLAGEDPAPTLVLLFDLHGFKAYNDDFGREAGDALLARLEERLGTVVPANGTAFRLPGDEFCLVAPVGEGDAELLIENALTALSEHGDGFRIGCSFGGALLPYEEPDARDGVRLADDRLTRQRRSKRNARSMDALAKALGERDELVSDTGRVESLAVAVGGLLGIRGERLDALARAAELHDLGRLSIPREILDKPGPLDEQEWEFVRQQTLVAERVIRTSYVLPDAASIVRATCENWDGTGYPDRRAGKDIPLAARIIRVCHAFDAMLSPRPYRDPLSPQQALAELDARAGTSFDPAVVGVLSALVTAGEEGRYAA